MGVRSVTAACPGGPTIDGLLLDECVTRTFPVGGVDKTIKVYYTKVMSTTPRMEDGVNYNLQHWINSDAEAEQVAAWFQDAWQRFHTDSGHHLYDDGCSNTINVQMEDGIGWSGIAYWGSSGNCRIGMEDTVHIAKGKLTSGNGELVDRARSIVESMGGELATAEEARERLGLL